MDSGWQFEGHGHIGASSRGGSRKSLRLGAAASAQTGPGVGYDRPALTGAICRQYAAAQKANELGQPLLAVFGLTDHYPSANARHYAFMLEGLRDAQKSLARRGIRLVVQKGAPRGWIDVLRLETSAKRQRVDVAPSSQVTAQ